MITFEQFKTDYRKKEELEGTKQEVINGQILSRGPLTDTELLQMYNSMQSEAATGIEHHGEIIGGEHVLTLKGIGY